jgi:hypothetical protein
MRITSELLRMRNKIGMPGMLHKLRSNKVFGSWPGEPSQILAVAKGRALPEKKN